jgi:hypothetical protein
MGPIRELWTTAYFYAFGPRWRAAVIDVRKFRDYSMLPNHPPNGGKHLAFERLGWEVTTATSRETSALEVITLIRRACPRRVRRARPSSFGPRFETEVRVRGPNGSTGTLHLFWQLDRGHETPRLITNWLQVHV